MANAVKTIYSEDNVTILCLRAFGDNCDPQILQYKAYLLCYFNSCMRRFVFHWDINGPYSPALASFISANYRDVKLCGCQWVLTETLHTAVNRVNKLQSYMPDGFSVEEWYCLLASMQYVLCNKGSFTGESDDRYTLKNIYSSLLQYFPQYSEGQLENVYFTLRKHGFPDKIKYYTPWEEGLPVCFGWNWIVGNKKHDGHKTVVDFKENFPIIPPDSKVSVIISFQLKKKGDMYYKGSQKLLFHKSKPYIKYLYLPFDDGSGFGTFYHFRKCTLINSPSYGGNAVFQLEEPDAEWKPLICCTEDGKDWYADLNNMKWNDIQEAMFLDTVCRYEKRPFLEAKDRDFVEPIFALGSLDGLPEDTTQCNGFYKSDHWRYCWPVDFLAVSVKSKDGISLPMGTNGFQGSMGSEGVNTNSSKKSCTEEENISESSVVDDSGIYDENAVNAIRKINFDYSRFTADGCRDETGRLEGILLPFARKAADECRELEKSPVSDRNPEMYRDLVKAIQEVSDGVRKVCASSSKKAALAEMMGVHAEIDAFRTRQKMCMVPTDHVRDNGKETGGNV